MARNRKEKDAKIPLKQPDRSGPDPSQETLLEMASQRGLLNIPQAVGKNKNKAEPAADDEPLIGRLGDSMLWTFSLTMLHFSMDVLVARQYAVEIEWDKLVWRSLQAFPVFLFLFYSLHPHPSPSILLPRIRIPPILQQLFFFIASVSAGSYLIHITNQAGYYAVQKQAPPLGCLWIWSVIELDLVWACGSLLGCIAFLQFGGYSFL